MVEVTTQDAPTDFESIQSNDEEEESGSDYSECNCGEIHTYYKLNEALKLPQAESKKLGGYRKTGSMFQYLVRIDFQNCQ